MKKRLFRNLLVLGLLLVALTAAVSAQYTADVNGKKVRTNILIEYFCNSCGKTHALEDSDYTINSFQARTRRWHSEAVDRVEVWRWSRPVRKRQGHYFHGVSSRNEHQRANV